MWRQNTKASVIRKGNGNGNGNGLVAVAVDKDNKGSRHALKWAADSLLTRGQTLLLIHVLHTKSPHVSSCSEGIICNTNSPDVSPHRDQLVSITKELFHTFHCYCTRKDIQCLDVLLEDTDVVKGITEYVSYAAIENLVLGAASRHGFIRFKSSSKPSSIAKGAPDFCTVYIISKGKISSVRSASRAAPHSSPLLKHVQNLNNESNHPKITSSRRMSVGFRDHHRTSFKPHSWQDESIKVGKRIGLSGRSCMDYSESETDISFISSDKPSTSSGRSSSVYSNYIDSGRNSRISTTSDHSLGTGFMFNDHNSPDLSFSKESKRISSSYSNKNMDEEVGMRRSGLELKQMIEMYGAARKEALTAGQKLMELNHQRTEAEQKIDETRLSQQVSLATIEKEKAISKTTLEKIDADTKVSEMEALKEAEEMRKLLNNVVQADERYKRYTIEEIEIATDFFSESRKIGEGGYGPVYKCYLDHIPAAVKVLRPDSTQGKSQFQKEVDILSCMRHPNMVLLLGACPDHNILIYEYMENGSLEDCMFRKKDENLMSWQVRFHIAAEIATGLLFLHETKPEPLVHRDLKPSNILLDHNYVSKISDVGLARILPVVAENVTQCHMTSAAGTFCYIDPEYQQTGTIGVKSDVYSLGIILLQLLTGKTPMGLAYQVGESIENDTFVEMLDKSVHEWPLQETLCLAKMAVKCVELRRKDRPDLGKQVLPELQRLRDFAEDIMSPTTTFFGEEDSSSESSPNASQASIL
ncbi:PREDICTED: U-box domain-containing protein 35-like isoform X1 [Lupinus angustifolius]|uniref:U-box domain-containing protein 35-like isoform X1 n=1 Tax=Lupinus angustifolius TaxID=3871 RepID=UPI00092E3481|nr:PREDICTED: U-box domain-containing protein 35-like isoform X1 [Lupinus angustifolius]